MLLIILIMAIGLVWPNALPQLLAEHQVRWTILHVIDAICTVVIGVTILWSHVCTVHVADELFCDCTKSRGNFMYALLLVKRLVQSHDIGFGKH